MLTPKTKMLAQVTRAWRQHQLLQLTQSDSEIVVYL